MNKRIAVFFIFAAFILSQDETTNFVLESYFSAIIVSDIDSSTPWYKSLLNLDQLDRIENNERGFKIAILANDKVLIELIEFKNGITKKSALENLAENKRLIGHFKIGYRVGDFEEWHRRLENMDIEFYGKTFTDRNLGKRSFIILDPDGNYIQFFER